MGPIPPIVDFSEAWTYQRNIPQISVVFNGRRAWVRGGVVAEESQDQNETYFGVGQIQTVSWIARNKRKG